MRRRRLGLRHGRRRRFTRRRALVRGEDRREGGKKRVGVGPSIRSRGFIEGLVISEENPPLFQLHQREPHKS